MAQNYSPKSSARHVSSDHDYILVFSKSAAAFRPNPMPRTERQNKAYRNPDDDPRGPWKTSDLSATPTALEPAASPRRVGVSVQALADVVDGLVDEPRLAGFVQFVAQ